MSSFIKKSLILLLVGFILLAGISFVAAQNPPADDNTAPVTDPTLIGLNPNINQPVPTAAPQPGTTTDECKQPLQLQIDGSASIWNGTVFIEALGWLMVALWINPALWLLGVVAFYMQQMIMFRVLGLDAVKILWTLLRDFVNLGFVFGMAVIAISTMLDIGKYTAQRTLLKLITAALLINFTLVFIGFFLDLNNIGSSALLYKMTQGQTLQAILYNGSGANAISQGEVQKACGEAIQISVTKGTALVNLTAKGIFLTIIVIIFLVIFLAYVIRIAHLVQLTILSPLIWTSYVFGVGTSETSWGGWWSNFFKWCFMPTISLFYIYLAFTVYATMVGSGGFIETSTNGKDATQAIFSMAINTVVLGALLSAAIKAAWESSGALASVLQGALAVASKSLVGQLGKMALGTIARTGLGSLARGAGAKMTQAGLQKTGGMFGWRGAAGKLQAQLGQGIQRAGEKTEAPLRKAEQERIKAMNEDTLKENAKKALEKPVGKLSGKEKVEQQELVKAAMDKGLLNGANADQMKNMVKTFETEADPDARKELMRSFAKNASKFTDTKALNELVNSGTFTTTKKDSQGRVIQVKDTETAMSIGTELAKKKALDTKTIEYLGFNNTANHESLKNDYKDAYKAITSSYVAYNKDVLEAGGLHTDAGATTAARIVTNMNQSERSNIDIKSLMNEANGEEVVIRSGDALISNVAHDSKAKDHLTQIREKLDRQAAAAGQTTQEYTKTNHKSLYNGIAKRSSHIGLIDSSNPMAEWKPEKKEKGQKKDTLSRIREGRETSRGQARPAQERGALTANEERLHQEERQRRIGSNGGYRGPYIPGRPPATS